MNGKIVKIIGLAASVITVGAGIAREWVDKQELSNEIDEKVNEALAKRGVITKES